MSVSSLRRARLSRPLSRTFALGALLALPAAAFAQQQQPAEDVVQLEKFVSIGTRFNDRTVINSPVPVDVFTENEIRGTGYAEVTQVLQSQVPSFVFPRTSGVAGTTLQRPAGLRGLSPDQTLVLINGKRRYTSALVNSSGSFGRGSQAVDLNAIPTQAIGGAEILRDGAAAQYGSDAIAGVINFQLRRSLGAELVTSYGQYYKGDGETLDTSFNFGLPIGTRGGFLNTTLYYQNREATKTEADDPRQYYFGLNAAGNPVQWSTASVARPATPPSPATQYDPRELTVDRDRSKWGDPESEARGFFFNSEIPLNDRVKWYGFGGYGFRDSSTFYLLIRPGDATNVRAIHPDGFVTRLQGEIEDASFSTGLEGSVGEWQWDLSETWGRNAVDYWTHDTVNPSYGLASPTSFYAGRLTFQQATTNLDVTRAFDFVTGHPLKVAFGGEFRWENYTVGAGDDASWKDGGQLILDGPSAGQKAAVGSQGFPGFRPIDVTDRNRDSYAAYVDLENNLTDRWLVGVAGRAEEYSDAGSSVTGKLSTRFEITKTLAVRGSVSTGFRAPSLGQSVYSKTQLFGNTGTSGRTSAFIKTFPVDSAVARGLGAKELTPEESTNYSIGLTFQPNSRLSFAVDAYQIEVKDQITLSSNLLSLVNNPALENYIEATDPLARGVTGVNYFLNAVDSRARGLDFTSRYQWEPVSQHKFTFTLGLNLNRNEILRIAATPPEVAAITGRAQDIFDTSQRTLFEHGNPRIKGVASVTYDLGRRWSFVVRPAYYGKTSSINVNTGNTTQVFSDNWVADLDLIFKVNKHLTLVVGANNVFDVYPDRIEGAIGGRQYDQNLSPFGWNGGYYYTRVNYKF